MTWVLWLVLLAFTVGTLTVLFPFTAAVLALFHRSPKLPPPDGPISLEVLIPAFNEADTIQRTLESIVASGRRLLTVKPEARLGITVALDGSTDSTRAIVQDLSAKLQAPNLRVRVIDRKENQGKWATIGELIIQSEGYWSALVDSGTLWPEKFLERLAKRLETSRCVGIAPGYEQTSAGRISKFIWWQERMLKLLENLAGGPVSLHGATMIFRTAELRDTFVELNTQAWLNDDVVLGLAMRTRGRIAYLSWIRVGDCGVHENRSEKGRRRRLVLGNLEWIRGLFPTVLGESPVVGLLALRRVARLLWAYSLIVSIFLVGMLLRLGPYWSLALVAFTCGLASQNRTLREAGALSLAVPLWINKRTKVRWS